jgi:drug/metabolite transporter (DMT)-like permease
MYRTQLQWQPIALLLLITMIWGSNMAFVKIASREMAPIFMAGLAQPLQILFYQLFFSAPFLLIISMVMEDAILWSVSFTLVFSLFYQCIMVAFLGYLVWFVLVSRYPVSLMHAFSFFTPVFGVLFSGVLILGETISPNLVMALILVSIGMVLVNYQPKPVPSTTNMQD